MSDTPQDIPRQAHSTETQDIAGTQSTDLQDVVREKVAEAVYTRRPYHLLTWQQLPSYEAEARRCDADAAISATLQAILDADLSRIKPSLDHWSFKGIVAALLPLLTKEAK